MNWLLFWWTLAATQWVVMAIGSSARGSELVFIEAPIAGVCLYAVTVNMRQRD